MGFYIKPKYGEEANLCHMDTDSIIVYKKAKYIYVDTAMDVEAFKQKLFISNYELQRSFSERKNKKVIELMKDD